MATTNVATLPSGIEEMRKKTPHIYHRPHVYKSKGRFGKWWSACPCGHLKFYSKWHVAYIDALIHSESFR